MNKYTCIHTYRVVYIHVKIHTHTHTYIYIYIYIYIYTHYQSKVFGHSQKFLFIILNMSLHEPH